MIKKLKPRGKNTLVVEIQGLSNHGLWIFVKDREFFIPFTKYPWFKQATIDQIYNFECFHGKHLHWPALDVDVEIDALDNPDAYPLIYKK